MSKIYEKSCYREITGNAKRASEADIMPPVFLCETCDYCVKSRCNILKRHVIPDYNRCFYHSDYTPVRANFSHRLYGEDIYKYA